MRNAQKMPAAALPQPRFGVVLGGRSASVATVPVAARGLFLITESNRPAANFAPGDSFAQARQIVEQVEREIASQAERERLIRRHGLRVLAVRPLAAQKPLSMLQRALGLFRLNLRRAEA